MKLVLGIVIYIVIKLAVASRQPERFLTYSVFHFKGIP